VKRGFSLIEVLMAIVIMTVLVAGITSALRGKQRAAPPIASSLTHPCVR
jgi:prepilin-type N-terminal cleavage/methylation domain-containing protein